MPSDLSSSNKNTSETTGLVKTFLGNQTKELEIKAEQLALSKQEDEHGFEFGIVALKAKVEDRDLHRKHTLKVRLYTYVLITVTMLLVFIVIFYAIYSGNNDIAMEIIKAIIYLSGGGLGGYGIAKTFKSNSTTNNK